MSKTSELYNLCHSFSGDRKITSHSRSGDSNGDGAELWNFVAHTQSAEDDIIEVESRFELLKSKRRFVKILLKFFKKILTSGEFQFLFTCIFSDKSPYRVGLDLGIDYFQTCARILACYANYKLSLFRFMSSNGYNLWRGLSFVPRLEKYFQSRKHCREYYKANLEECRKRYREYYKANLEECRKRCREYYKANLEECRKRCREYRQANIEKFQIYRREYYQLHREQCHRYRIKYYLADIERWRLYRREYYQVHKEQIKLVSERYRKTHKEQFCESQKRYIESHREQYLDYQKRYAEEHKEEHREAQRRYYQRKKTTLTEEQLAARRAACRDYMRNLRAKQKVIDI